jgi:iron transport multicopper oxidase
MSWVSQCPVAANHSFLYDFQTSGQAGTFWYHSHLGKSGNSQESRFAHILAESQWCDGLRGAFILDDPEDPHQDLYDVDDGALYCFLFKNITELLACYSESTIITLSDWLVLR